MLWLTPYFNLFYQRIILSFILIVCLIYIMNYLPVTDHWEVFRPVIIPSGSKELNIQRSNTQFTRNKLTSSIFLEALYMDEDKKKMRSYSVNACGPIIAQPLLRDRLGNGLPYGIGNLENGSYRVSEIVQDIKHDNPFIFQKRNINIDFNSKPKRTKLTSIDNEKKRSIKDFLQNKLMPFLPDSLVYQVIMSRSIWLFLMWWIPGVMRLKKVAVPLFRELFIIRFGDNEAVNFLSDSINITAGCGFLVSFSSGVAIDFGASKRVITITTWTGKQII